ncbi:transcriptional regulator PpsR [Craurococcus roseus]|uniref:Transcriptional regulator PpsR n=1 Tax=Craurococcus roseus TaxID=77585 RepID=A0ABN1GB04_9PROT
MHAFRAPETSLGELDAEATASLIAAAADIALVVDGAGVIRDYAVNSEELSRELGGGDWFGRPWLDTVTEESRPKVEALIRDAAARAAPRWRHINQLAVPGGASVPILFSAVRLGKADRAVAFGRDLRGISALQQRLMDAQRSVERDYARLRQAETRYRLLFQMSPEPVLVLDAAGFKVQEVNPAAARLFGKDARRAIGRPFAEAFDAGSQAAVESLMSGVRAAGRADDVRARLLSDERPEVVVSASLFRQDDVVSVLVRLSPVPVARPGEPIALPKTKTKLLKLVEGVPDGFVVTGQDGRVLSANAAFLEMAQIAVEEQAVGESLERWFAPPGVELDVLMGSLRQRGAVRLFAATLQGEYGAATEVEISAVTVMNGGQPCFGFAIRDVGMRLPRPARGDAHAGGGRTPLRSVEQITELIGRVPLKDLVREATDVIERLCIEAALDLTSDNRASAAEMLGLSRQSLYVKLRRYGLGDLGAEDGGNGPAE